MEQHFICVVAGDEPNEILRRYDSHTLLEPYVVYQFDKVKQYRDMRRNILEEALKKIENENIKDFILLDLEELEKLNDLDFYNKITENLNVDKVTGDAYATLNYNARFDGFSIGVDSMNLGMDANGKPIFSTLKKNVDFSKIHKTDTKNYELSWNLIKEDKKPKGEYEVKLYERIKDWDEYFSSFGTKKNYLACSTMFWGHAFTDGKDWDEYDNEHDQYEWVSKFYDHFIKPLSDDTKITICDCWRK